MSLQLLMKLAVIIINFFTFSIYIFNLKNYAVYGLLQGLSSKKSACNAGDVGLFPDWEDPLEEGMATHSTILA